MSNIEELKRISTQVRRDIVRMVTMAKSGHPGGSMSSAGEGMPKAATHSSCPPVTLHRFTIRCFQGPDIFQSPSLRHSDSSGPDFRDILVSKLGFPAFIRHQVLLARGFLQPAGLHWERNLTKMEIRYM